MEPIPVIHSILSAKYLGTFVQEKYGLSPDTSCEILKTGINHTYLISDKIKRYIFRVYCFNWRSENEILEELRLIGLLKNENISVSYPLYDLKENYIQKIKAPEGERYAVLFSFAAGEKIRNLTEDNCKAIGTLMGRVHKTTENERLDRVAYNLEGLTQLFFRHTPRFFQDTMDEMQFVEKSVEQLKFIFQKADKSKLRYGVVHLDMWYDNMSITDESEITLFDFDFCGNGWLLLDVAYCIMQMFHTEPDKNKFESKLKSFFSGYEGEVHLTAEEKDLLPYAGLAIWIFYLGTQAQRFDNWSNIFFSEFHLKHFIALAKRWLDYHKVKMPFDFS
jgi:Ser/Thr protein kinase RdoA (MazF antagonist)